MSTSSMGSSGIFAKLVAKFLVKWIRKTRARKSNPPALSAAPPQVAGRPERDRSRETFGAHAGSSGPRASAAPAPAAALQGGGYGAHRGISTRTATVTTATYDPTDVESRLAAMWNTGERQARGEALRAADSGMLREAGMNQQQVTQAGNGRVPTGYQMERVPGTDAAPSHYQLAPTSAQSQCNCNAVNGTITEIRFDKVSVISLPIGGQQITVVLGGGATLAG